MPKEKTNQRISELEATIKVLERDVYALEFEVQRLTISIATIRNKPDPWRPIGPRPDQPLKFQRELGSPWRITCENKDSK